MKVFISYCHADESLREVLEKHLSLLKNQGVIDVWHDRKIVAGNEFATAIDANLSDAQIVLLLVSADFLASQYCWGVEMKLAMERHESGEAHVVPVILRACDWHTAPFGKLSAVPKDGRPIKSWLDIDEALYDVARQIRSTVLAIANKVGSASNSAASPAAQPIEFDSTQAPSKIANVCCSRCGARAGVQSVCTGHHTYHDFTRLGPFGSYCARCGVMAGIQSTCTGHHTYHDFVNAERAPAFCTRCGMLAGKQSICTGSNTYHDFKAV
ncbi:TIR domain-containing protein [Bradyrhizobium sp.]|uniref:TIR domain-containing protein n=1 Tax=Bradyrhizobium sp. TaxID=376 RepID=UPI002C958D87|nr:TIR domain-containing protein [Bradyrhizobium sp.]HMM87715.1 TIR domain-containing protein [Bradyrhizobium sp.]